MKEIRQWFIIGFCIGALLGIWAGIIDRRALRSTINELKSDYSALLNNLDDVRAIRQDPPNDTNILFEIIDDPTNVVIGGTMDNCYTLHMVTPPWVTNPATVRSETKRLKPDGVFLADPPADDGVPIKP